MESSKYPWYELIHNSDKITQGDIIGNCPTYANHKKDKLGKIKAEKTLINGIILTQACDIENGKLKNIIVCPVIDVRQFIQDQCNNGKSKKEIINIIEQIRKGYQISYHLLNEYKEDGEYYIVNFRDIYSIPINQLKAAAEDMNKRKRLLSPYREHLSQAFARCFMRVGLPTNIDIDTKKIIDELGSN